MNRLLLILLFIPSLAFAAPGDQYCIYNFNRSACEGISLIGLSFCAAHTNAGDVGDLLDSICDDGFLYKNQAITLAASATSLTNQRNDCYNDFDSLKVTTSQAVKDYNDLVSQYDAAVSQIKTLSAQLTAANAKILKLNKQIKKLKKH